MLSARFSYLADVDYVTWNGHVIYLREGKFELFW